MVVDSTRHTDRRREEKPIGRRAEWIERLDWVRREAESQISWMDQIDADVVPPGGRSILGHWLDLSRLQTERYLPLLRSIIQSKSHPDVPSEDECLAMNREEDPPEDLQLPSKVANDRQLLTTLLESTSESQWRWLEESGDDSGTSPFLSLLNEISERDRLILREMSLQLLDRHREDLGQREIRQRMPSRKET